MDHSDKLTKINYAFSKLSEQEERFKRFERAYRASWDSYEDFKKRNHLIKKEGLTRSKLYVPLIKTTCNILHSLFKTSFLSNGCPIEITRIGLRSEHDLLLQNALNAAVKIFWRESSHKIGLSRAVLSAIYLPLGVLSLYWSDSQVKTKHIPINDIAFDPDCSDINDIEYVCYRYKASKREVEEKFKSGLYINDEAKDEILRSSEYERIEISEIYEKKRDKGKLIWNLSAFANDKFVRSAKFSYLPFHFGYTIESMPPIDKSLRSSHIGVYGSCVPEMVQEIQEEYNIKRNQKIDLVESAIDPQVAINSTAGAISMEDLKFRRKYVRVETNMGASVRDMIVPLHEGNNYALTEEIAMLNKEYEIATGVNSVMTGQTSPSDRRAMGALQIVNASSSMRVESMMMTLVDTMLNGYARHFVELIYHNIADEDIIAITESKDIIEKIGTKEERKNAFLDFDIKTNFGTTISQEIQINQLNTLISVLAQYGVNNADLLMPILKDLIVLMRGENAPIEELNKAFETMKASQNPPPPELSEEEKQKMSLIAGGL